MSKARTDLNKLRPILAQLDKKVKQCMTLLDWLYQDLPGAKEVIDKRLKPKPAVTDQLSALKQDSQAQDSSVPNRYEALGQPSPSSEVTISGVDSNPDLNGTYKVVANGQEAVSEA